MTLCSLEIENYKSVAESICIDFHENLPTVLIGKNGSGKSNILEAVERIVATNSYLPRKYSADGLRYKACIRMDKDEFSTLFPNERYEKEKATFWAYASSEDGLHINTIESKFVVPLLKKELDDINTIANEVLEAIEEYETALGKIAYEDYNPLSLRGFEIVDVKGNTTDYSVLEYQTRWYVERVKEATAEYDNYINTFVFSPPRLESFPSLITSCYNFLPFKLRYKKPELAFFEQEFITIDEAAIKQEIEKINQQTEIACQKIDALLTKLKKQSEKLLDTDGMELSGEITKFVQKVQNIFGKHCGYLLNENSWELFRNYQKENDVRYHDPFRIVFEAYATSTGKEALLEENGHKFNDCDLKAFEKWLNDNRPEFDQGMYRNITVSTNEKGNISIQLEENNGQIVSLNETSAGRRWYFTYYFVKCTLSESDTFIIDEPASMLHPSAQKEVLKDLIDLSQKGIRVIYSTHSPYLIPKERKGVHLVSMMDSGTKVTEFSSDQELISQVTEIVGEDIFDIQSVLERYFLADKTDVARNISMLIREVQKERGIKNLEKVCDEIEISYSSMKSWNCNPIKPNGQKNKKLSAPSEKNIIKVLKWANKI